MFKILYLPTAELVKLPAGYTLPDIQRIFDSPFYCFFRIGKKDAILIGNRTPPSPDYVPAYAYPELPKYLFELIEVPDV